MALRLAMLKSAGGTAGWTLPFRRWAHATALPLPLDTAISSQIPPPPLVLPEFDRNGDTTNYNNNSEFGFPSYSFAGSMELMAVPKKKVSRHKRGIRNGPKALKPVPVIVRCKGCGRVKLPHFFCCSGERKNHE
ncbi:hypothetical protein AB3S75_036150 [Citrus x aurantiifolia]